MEITPETKSGLIKKSIASLILICVISGATAWYFLYFTKTPEYSLNLVKESIQTHDLTKFKKHIDLDSVISRGYDDLISAMIESDDSMKPEAKKMVAAFIQMIKIPAVTGLKDAVSRYVETGKWADEPTATQPQPTPADIQPDKIAERSGLKDSTVRGIAYSKKDDNSAVVGLTIFDKITDKESVLDIQMRELADGTWQIAEISNFKDYIINLENTRNEILKNYIAATQASLDKNAAAIGELNKKNSAPSREGQRALILELQKNYQECIASLESIPVPAAAKNFSAERKHLLLLRIQLLDKQIEYLDSNDLKALGTIKGLNVQIATLENHLAKIKEKVGKN